MLKQILGEWYPVWKPTRWKATLIALPIICLVVPLIFLALPYLEALNDMAVQPKGKPQGHYGWFSDEIIPVHRPPVEGSVPMGVDPMAYEYVVTEEDEEKAAKIAGETLENPVRATPEVLARGRAIFNRICFTCHGERGEGDGPVVGAEFFPAPPSLHTPQAQAYPDGRIWHIATRGQNKMPSYAHILEPVERWQVVHYIRALQRAKQKGEQAAQARKDAESRAAGDDPKDEEDK